MHVCFIPFDKGNPYQPQLAMHLRLLGVSVETRGSLKGLIGDILRGTETSDVIHLHWLPHFKPNIAGLIRSLLFWLRMLALRALGRRIIWTAHNLYAHEAQSRALERWNTQRVISNASVIIAHSKTAQAIVSGAFSVSDPRKFAVVPHGNYVGCYANTLSKAEARVRLQLPAGALVILFFGNIRPYKGVAELIDAYQQLAGTSSVLVIAGRPLNHKIVSEIEHRIANDRRIQLQATFIPDGDVQNYMNAADVVVFPYQETLTSGAVILAMSFGRACIAPALGCIPDVLDERGAFVYDPMLPDGLRNAMELAIQDRARLSEMGEYNRRRAEQWSWDRVAKKTADIYAQSLRSPYRSGQSRRDEYDSRTAASTDD